jgi:hypothetical protein
MDAKRQEVLDNLKSLWKKRDELQGELQRSLAIQELWPEAFEHGRVFSHVEGNPGSGFFLTIKRGDGEERKFNIKEVPTILIPESFLEDCLSRNYCYGYRWYKWAKEVGHDKEQK